LHTRFPAVVVVRSQEVTTGRYDEGPMAEPWTILAVISLSAEVWFPNFVKGCILMNF